MTIDSTLLIIAPEHSAVSESDRAAAIALAEKRVGSAFGDLREQAIAYLTAHILTVSQRAGSGGSVRMKKEGDLQIMYADPASKNAALGQTAYGMEFEQIRKMKIMGARTRAV